MIILHVVLSCVKCIITQFNDNDYALWVTDPDIERYYLACEDGYYDLDECYLTISLGEPFNENCYKLVASVIKRPR